MGRDVTIILTALCALVAVGMIFDLGRRIFNWLFPWK